MLFLLNSPHSDMVELITMIADKNYDIDIILLSDAAYLATPFMLERLRALNVNHVYVAKDAVESRAVESSEGCEIVDYSGIVDLIMDGDKKVISI